MARQIRHRNTSLIWLFDYPSLEAMDDCAEHLVWLSERDINMLWNAIQNIDKWRSRVFTSANGNLYETVEDEEFDIFVGWVADLRNNLGAYLMCNELLSEIKDALVALAEKECCPGGGGGGGVGGGSRGAGLGPADPTTITSTPTDREGPAPEGFEDWPEFDSYKCNMAHYIINDMISDIATMGLLGASSLTVFALASAFVTAMLTPIGWALMVPIAGLVINLLIVGANVSALTSFLGGKKDELVCAMLDGDTVANSIDSYTDAIDNLVPEDSVISAFGAVAEYLAIRLLSAMATTDSFNRLYKKVAYEIPGGNDCSGCETPTSSYTVNYGTETSENPANPIVIEMVFEAGYACGANARNAGINFSEAVLITGINIDGVGTGQCSGAPLFAYGTDPGDQAGVDAPDASDSAYPTPEDPTVPIYAIYVLCAVTSGNPTLTVTYTLP